MLLRDIAHSRTGDKGNRSTISVIAFDLKDFAAIERCITAERVRKHCARISEQPRSMWPRLSLWRNHA